MTPVNRNDWTGRIENEIGAIVVGLYFSHEVTKNTKGKSVRRRVRGLRRKDAKIYIPI